MQPGQRHGEQRRQPQRRPELWRQGRLRRQGQSAAGRAPARRLPQRWRLWRLTGLQSWRLAELHGQQAAAAASQRQPQGLARRARPALPAPGPGGGLRGGVACFAEGAACGQGARVLEGGVRRPPGPAPPSPRGLLVRWPPSGGDRAPRGHEEGDRGQTRERRRLQRGAPRPPRPWRIGRGALRRAGRDDAAWGLAERGVAQPPDGHGRAGGAGAPGGGLGRPGGHAEARPPRGQVHRIDSDERHLGARRQEARSSRGRAGRVLPEEPARRRGRGARELAPGRLLQDGRHAPA
mmetsp:Transcript_6687/g.17985  ORF Transcript_6687/g.17985 Transcript_6687/m.17985 type:complete len:293 (+) Transcript_6687:372-1250(+)